MNDGRRLPWLASGIAIASLAWSCGGGAQQQQSAGSSSSSGSGGGTSSSASSGTGATGGSGGTGTTTTTSASGGTGGAPTGLRLGTVGLDSGAQSATVLHGFKASAGFASWAMGSPAVSTTMTVGACAVTHFTMPASVSGNQVEESAGVITLTGGNQPVTLTPDAAGKYADVKGSADLFAGGEMITVTAAGAAVPAFMATLVAPSPVDLTAPTEPMNKGPLPVDRQKDLVFTWTNGGAGSVVVQMGDSIATGMVCTFPSAAGTGTIPHAALAALAPGAMGFFAIAAASIQEIDTGGWSIAVLVGNTLTWNGVANPQTFSYQATN